MTENRPIPRKLIIGAVIAGLAIAATLTFALRPGQASSPPPLALSILDQPPDSQDALPPALVDMAEKASEAFKVTLYPADARYVTSGPDGTRYWLVPGEQSSLCLVSQLTPSPGVEGGNGLGCSTADGVANGTLFIGTPTSDTAQTVVGVVTDDVVAVTSGTGVRTQVSENGYVLEGAGSGSHLRRRKRDSAGR